MELRIAAALCGMLLLTLAVGCGSQQEQNPPSILEEHQVISQAEFSPPSLKAKLAGLENPVEIPAISWGEEGSLEDLSQTTATCMNPMPSEQGLPQLTLEPAADTTEVEAFEGEESLWQGTLEELQQGEWQPQEGSTVKLVIKAVWEQDDGSRIQAEYLLPVTISASESAPEESVSEESAPEESTSAESVSQQEAPQTEPETAENAVSDSEEEPSDLISLSSDTVQAGRLTVIRFEDVPEEFPTIETDLGFTPTFFEDDGGLTAYLPVNNGTQPGEYHVTVRWNGGEEQLPLTVTEGEFDVEVITMDQEVADSTVNSSTANTEFETVTRPLKNQSDDEQYWSGPFVMPVEMNPVRTSSSFGYTRLINGVADRHNGVDFPVAKGTPVTAPNNGRVLYAGYLQLTGNTVCIEHGFGLKSWYYHMDSLSCATGDFLETGDPVGAVGSTGYSTGPHLHFALSINNVYIDPFQLMEEDLS